jgi:hypothetical protein
VFQERQGRSRRLQHHAALLGGQHSECKVEDLATSAYLRLTRILSSSKVDAMARAAKHDEKLGYATVPLTITFGTLEDKNVFKDKARDLGLTKCTK